MTVLALNSHSTPTSNKTSPSIKKPVTFLKTAKISKPSPVYIAKTENKVSVPEEAPVETVSYTVKSGDTLIGIAEKFKTDWKLLAEINYIYDPYLIFIGQKIIIKGEPLPLKAPEPDILDGKEIVVVLSQQRTYIFENGELVKTFIVSTGVSQFPTVTGKFRIKTKLEETRMTGPGYDLPNVPWTMYFFESYAFHGTYWHSNFGHPMSHGCVNMRTEDAEWLYHWADIGTDILILP